MTATDIDRIPDHGSEPRVRVRLGDLGLAPENLRFREPPDAGIPRLADTIRAAGVLYPPLVRPARKGEAGTHMVLDGRRRRYAWLLQVERGEKSLDDEVECVLAEGRAAQAAAVVLTATELAPVHLADVIVAIGKLRRSRMSTAGVAAALGYDELEIKRLEALSAVHPKVLEAFRGARLTLRQVRMFARLVDRDRQAELAQGALDGYFQEYRLQQAVQADRVTVEADALRLVGAARYAAAGGRVRADLFGELPDVILDPAVLETAWRERAEEFAHALRAEGLAVHLGDDRGFGAPEGLHRLPYVYDRALPEGARAAYAAARAAVDARRAALAGVDLADEAVAPRLAELLAARLAEARAGLAEGAVEAVLLHPCAEDGIAATFFWRPADSEDEDPAAAADDEEAAGADNGESPPARRSAPDVAAPDVEMDVVGVGHALHALRTDIATRGLIRDLADHPGAALTAVTAHLFRQVALRDPLTRDASALALRGERYGPAGMAEVAGLDGEVRARLARRREAYLASGLRPIPWVDSLTHAERVTLLAEAAALCLDVHEARTTGGRPDARGEATEIAALCGADLARHWTPDARFLNAHSRAQLRAMLAELGVEDAPGAGLKKGDLVDRVAEAAAQRRWVPAVLRWSPAPARDEDVEAAATDGAAAGEDDPTDEAADLQLGT